MMRFYGSMMTQAQIGAQLGMSQMHVSRLQARALTFLRDRISYLRQLRVRAVAARRWSLPRGSTLIPSLGARQEGCQLSAVTPAPVIRFILMSVRWSGMACRVWGVAARSKRSQAG
jgi:Sigma-70, region 4